MKNPRVNVTFEEPTSALLSTLALQNHQSVSSLVRELALEALELREDFYLSQVAAKADRPDGPMHSHEDAWK